MDMPLYPSWQDIVIRLALTVISATLIGLNREARGKAAGLRTSILVGLAAAISMIQANILLGVGGKPSDSFAVMDVLRFPLGVLTGVGFIGAGVILRRGALVTGVTTAATLWIMTAIGLAYGGGQLWLGVAGTLLAVATLTGAKWIDASISREHHATLALIGAGADPPELDAVLRPRGFRARFQGLERSTASETHRFVFDISWRRSGAIELPPDLLGAVRPYGQIDRLQLTSDPVE